ncbi:MAG: aldehyde ferredoxin oxidoreductase N-terminal domain-containing protein, partial [Desulfurococcaceae archaeon]
MESSDKYRVIFIDTSDEKSWIKEYSFNDVIGPIELGVKLHLFEYETWKKSAYDPLNALVIGTGLFTNSKLYGFHRFTFVFKSPITRGLHVASMGGAAYQFRVNAHAIVLIGRSDSPVILKIFDEGDGKPVVEFNKID